MNEETTGLHSAPVVFADPSQPIRHVDVMNRLRITGCHDCGVLFAVPLEIYVLRTHEKGNIYCPNGHLIELTPESENTEELALLQVQMVAEIRQARYDADQLRNTLARIPQVTVQPITEEELLRRVKFIVNRASRTDYGRPICRFCESNSSRDSGLKQHLKREHLKEIAEMPATYHA